MHLPATRLRDPLALTAGLKARLAAAGAVIACIWALAGWAW